MPINKAKPILKGCHLLVAEDNETNQMVVTRMLQMLGATYELASDGIEAIALFEAGEFDLALLDIEMPRKSGLDVMRHIRASSEAKAGIPIVALTAFVLEEHRGKIMAAGANGIIAKPVSDVAHFGEQVRAFLSKAPCANKTAAQTGIQASAFDELEATLGSEVMAEFVGNFNNDLENIRKELKAGLSAHDVEMLQGNLHKLLSLAGMAGATELLSQTQSTHAQAASLSKTELADAIANVVSNIVRLQDYVEQRQENGN